MTMGGGTLNLTSYPELIAPTFLETYPQFKPAGALAVEAIRFAQTQISIPLFGARAQEALFLLAADWLWSHPYGMGGRLDPDGKAMSPYKALFDRLKIQVTPRIIVV